MEINKERMKDEKGRYIVQGTSVTTYKRATDEWVAFGDIGVVA